MRVLSFIPAFLLAAASFVAAAPAPVDSTSGAPACVPPSGNDAPLHPIIAIIVDATASLQPYSDQLGSAASGTPDVQTVDGIVVRIQAVIQTTVTKLDAAVKVDLDGLDLVALRVAVFGFLNLVVGILSSLVVIVLGLSLRISAGLKTDITAMLNVVLALVASLRVLVTATLNIDLGTLLEVVVGVVNLLVSIMVNIVIVVA